jgi:hypothetical protein
VFYLATEFSMWPATRFVAGIAMAARSRSDTCHRDWPICQEMGITRKEAQVDDYFRKTSGFFLLDADPPECFIDLERHLTPRVGEAFHPGTHPIVALTENLCRRFATAASLHPTTCRSTQSLPVSRGDDPSIVLRATAPILQGFTPGCH